MVQRILITNGAIVHALKKTTPSYLSTLKEIARVERDRLSVAEAPEPVDEDEDGGPALPTEVHTPERKRMAGDLSRGAEPGLPTL